MPIVIMMNTIDCNENNKSMLIINTLLNLIGTSIELDAV